MIRYFRSFASNSKRDLRSESSNDDLIVFQDNIRDITDSLINHCEDRKLDENSNIQVSDEKIVGIVNDLFGAGSRSFSVTKATTRTNCDAGFASLRF